MKDIINAISELQESINKAENKHMKGYIYDSLMYRYMKAREAMARLEIREGRTSPDTAFRAMERDNLRFSVILNEVMGEHD